MAVQHEATFHYPHGSGEFGTRRLVEECDAHRQVFGAFFLFSGVRCPSTGGVLVSS